jgi:hypothetical protein
MNTKEIEAALRKDLKELLFRRFVNNEYFKFSDFFNEATLVKSKLKIDYDTCKYFIYDMIDEKTIEQVYENENSTPFLETNPNNGVESSMHFKIIVPNL